MLRSSGHCRAVRNAPLQCPSAPCHVGRGSRNVAATGPEGPPDKRCLFPTPLATSRSAPQGGAAQTAQRIAGLLASAPGAHPDGGRRREVRALLPGPDGER